LSVGRFFAQALIEHEREHEQEQEERAEFRPPKKYRPPHPMGVKGGCSPQNNLKNFEATKRASSRSQQILSEKFAYTT
jgi:hypothetical protein